MRRSMPTSLLNYIRPWLQERREAAQAAHNGRSIPVPSQMDGRREREGS